MENFWDYVSEMAELGVIPDDLSNIDFDFDDINLYGISKPPLTLAELYKIYRSEGYAKEHKRKGMGFISKKGIKSVQMKDKWYIPDNCSLLYRHIIAEQLWQNDFSKIDFQEEHYANPFVLIELLRLWVNPLFWEKPIRLDTVVVEGKAAVERFCEQRVDSIGDAYNYISSHRILDFADNPKICKENDESKGAFYAIHDWSVIARGETYYVQATLEGGHFSQTELRKMEPYNATDLRRSLILIAKNRGGKRAVELLNMLQAEWPTIKSFQINLKFVKQESIKQFEYAIFHAFNDLLNTLGEKHSDVPKEQSQNIKIAKNQSISSSVAFEQLLQCEKSEKGRVIKRLHELLDGKGGKDVAIVLAAAMHQYKYLLRMPSETQYTAVFKLVGTWRAVRAYIKSHTDSHGVYQESLEHVVI